LTKLNGNINPIYLDRNVVNQNHGWYPSGYTRLLLKISTPWGTYWTFGSIRNS